MFEFESRGTMIDMLNLEKELLLHLGFNVPVELNYEDAETFASKLQIIKENYFGKKPSTQVNSVVTDSPVNLNEEIKHMDSNVARYMETFNRIK